MVKLIKPVAGDWLLKVKGVPEDKIDINLIFNYDLQLKLNPLAKESYKAGETVKIDSFFEDNGTPIADQALYKSMKATLFVKDLDKGKTEEISLTQGKKAFPVNSKLGDSSEYEVVVKAEDNSFFRETAAQKITRSKEAKAPAAVKPVQTEMRNHFHGYMWSSVLF